jgi:hypothetical protein
MREIVRGQFSSGEDEMIMTMMKSNEESFTMTQAKRE